MNKKRVVILGAGVSGLSLALYLSQYSEELDIVVLEKSTRPGGWIRSDAESEFLFERGPHTFSTSRSPHLLEVAKMVGLESEILPSQDAAKKRYLCLGGRLRPIPKWPLLKALLRELRVETKLEDESIYDFACRRLSQDVAELLFDPMSLGVYAGDMRELSIEACFPFFKNLERQHGSLVKGLFLSALKKKKTQKTSTLFTFRQGVESLMGKMASHIKGNVHTGQEIKGLGFHENHIEIMTQDRVWEADHLFIALPPKAACELLAPHVPSIASLLEIKMAPVSVVNLGYKERVLPLKGFGYLVPTKEKQEILGVIFDSEIFPQQNRQPRETRLSVLMRGDMGCQEVAEKALANHLNITMKPVAALTTKAFIPQYVVGHKKQIERLREKMTESFPRCTLAGNYLEGVSVNDCLALSKKLAEEYRMGVVVQ